MHTPLPETALETNNTPRRMWGVIGLGALALAGAYGLVLAAGLAGAAEGITAFLLFLVGLGAATIASATGVGGGVVFLPAFEYLGEAGLVAIAASQIVGMSFIIQSFGMSTGSLSWLLRIYDHKNPDTGVPPRAFFSMLALVLAPALPALALTQAIFDAPPDAVLYWFKALSIGLGLTLLLTTLVGPRHVAVRLVPTRGDYAVLAVLGGIGGMATAFFSVGVGELVALYLFIRNFPLVTAAAAAVMVSALSVLAGVSHHIMTDPQPWGLLMFLIAGAVLGGAIAKYFALYLGARRLKLFAAAWITLSSAYLMWVA
ncbi:sulfite exporter TauE/SafE family protein [Kordiimonas aestuarii]|uniref:sulfite exporter TauE/SafE family protein n=1 Tax=Kordiimonas aestuarii TaxID=1005925 RepID=UPI0021CFB433|nr:sulfite exporter TauE/SafE family protein [Kordiimonas aestuarii]